MVSAGTATSVGGSIAWLGPCIRFVIDGLADQLVYPMLSFLTG